MSNVLIIPNNSSIVNSVKAIPKYFHARMYSCFACFISHNESIPAMIDSTIAAICDIP